MPFNMPSFEIQALIKTAVDSIKTVVDSIKTTTDTTKTGVDSLNTKQDSLLLKIQNGALKQNIAIFDKPGTYTWKCPDGVTAVVLTMFGGGAAGQSVTNQYDYVKNVYGGDGGFYVNRKAVQVVPGTTYQIVVGKGGAGVTPSGKTVAPGQAGGSSSAFGIICLGGATSSWSSPKEPSHPLVTKGTDPAIIDIGYNATDFALYTTPFGRPGKNTSATGATTLYLGGGGAGYGDGGNGKISSTATVVGIGAGSGASFNVAADSGGNGIVIIEY